MSRPWGRKVPFFDLKHQSPSSSSFLRMSLWHPHPAHVSMVLVPSLLALRSSPWPQGPTDPPRCLVWDPESPRGTDTCFLDEAALWLGQCPGRDAFPWCLTLA